MPLDHTHISHWFAQLPPREPRPSLPGPSEADVCIVGGGLTGLWTAYELRRSDPSREVVVLEREVAGFGASGRNGGWVLGELSGSRERWARRTSRAAVVALEQAIAGTVAEVEAVVRREQIECDFVRGGSLHVAQTPLELERLRALVEEDRRWELGPADSELLDGERVRERVAVDSVRGARFFAHCARVQPAALVRGLAEAVERSGARIHERTAVTRIEPGAAHTAAGAVRARYVVRATEGYTVELPGLRRSLVPLNSAMIVTEPLGDAVWREIGWTGAETVLDGRRRYAYLQRTADGRIAIGGRGNPYRFGSRADREGPLPAVTVAELRERLIELFPVLAGARVAAGWHGVLGVARDWSPAVGVDHATGLAWAGGYVGEGVAAANLAGRTLRDLILGRDSELTRLPWLGPLARRWEPEPLRYLGVHAVNRLLVSADRRERLRGRSSIAARAAGWLAGRSF